MMIEGMVRLLFPVLNLLFPVLKHILRPWTFIRAYVNDFSKMRNVGS